MDIRTGQGELRQLDAGGGGISIKMNGYAFAFTKKESNGRFCSYGVVDVFCKKDMVFGVHRTLGLTTLTKPLDVQGHFFANRFLPKANVIIIIMR